MGWHLRPLIILAVLSMVVCGLLFPVVITGIGQVLFPYQANGELVQVNGCTVGSNLIAQNTTLPIFFQPRNDSASGVDPDITIADAYAQAARISNATSIPQGNITALVNQNEEGTFWIFGTPYVNALKLNLLLIQTFPNKYEGFPLSGCH
jgi:potassium-transporting ATPase KdpC subunit